MLSVRGAHPAGLAAPELVAGLREALPAAELLDRQSGFGFTQEANDLLFSKTLLHFAAGGIGLYSWALLKSGEALGCRMVSTSVSLHSCCSKRIKPMPWVSLVGTSGLKVRLTIVMTKCRLSG